VLLHGILGYPDSAKNSNLEVVSIFATLKCVQFEDLEPNNQHHAVEPVNDPDPDNPAWGLLAGFGFWLVSVLLILIVPTIAVAIYAAANHIETQEQLKELVLTDKNAILINLAMIIPVHAATIAISWIIVTQFRRHDYFQSLGWDFGSFRAWHGILIIFGFFAVGAVVSHYFPDEENDLIKILRSSREATILVGLIATLSAPFVEEVVYRGVLYSAARKTVGTAGAVALTTFLLTLVHVPQYWPSYSTILLLFMLSLVLTLVRARTGRLLPCVVLHFVFNGIQSALLIVQAFQPSDVSIPEPAISSFFPGM
jgi:membrane protease YdiL (CAAX protease family)